MQIRRMHIAAPLTRKRAPASLACEPHRQKKIKEWYSRILPFIHGLTDYGVMTDRPVHNVAGGKSNVSTDKQQKPITGTNTKHPWNHKQLPSSKGPSKLDPVLKLSKSFVASKLVSMLRHYQGNYERQPSPPSAARARNQIPLPVHLLSAYARVPSDHDESFHGISYL